MKSCLYRMLLLFTAGTLLASELDEGWDTPPTDARLRAYWWWLNGNVTKQAITRDLEQMRTRGFGGALICDAGGAEQRGNARVPHGPTFFSPEWRELYKHALQEADRLDLEMSLNIQSGWNLGGPMVTPDDAPKKLVWTSRIISEPKALDEELARPAARDNYYRDLFVLAYKLKPARARSSVFSGVTASSSQSAHPASNTADGNSETFWVSESTQPSGGPTPGKPQWLEMNFTRSVAANRLTLVPRVSYGPRDCELQISDDGKTFRSVKAFTVAERDSTSIAFPTISGRVFRVVMTGAFDPRFPEAPRNAQVAELELAGPDGLLTREASPRRPLQNYEQKAMLKALHFSAPDTTPLLVESPAAPGEEDVQAGDVVNLTENLDADGTLRWDVPVGSWEVLRFGYTLNDHCRVSTHSEGWSGYALDPFDAGAFKRYWDAVVEPLIADAGPLAGGTLKYLHTDSWEVEVANWTPTLREEFLKRRGYDLLPWLPVIAGRIVNSREESNRFLHDFRRTMGDLAIDNHYRLFKERAHAHGMLIHPESGGPHAVPIDAQQCLGFNDAPMSEFWAWSWTHRIGDQNRFFVKQPASAAHTYGHKLVLAEGFTTIGPHWQERLWNNLKPSFDHGCTEGLNLLVWHAFVCSPESEGIPGQQYFAGTHLNPNVTWWDKSKPFFDYINRCQWMLQQGRSFADVLYYYGDHVPNFAQLKSSDPAHILPGYDYDIITAEALLARAAVREGMVVLPEGASYRLLVLPDRDQISLPVLRKISELVNAGATVVGPKPARGETLKDFAETDVEVRQVAAALWGGQHGKGRVISGKTARQVLLDDGVPPDCEFRPASSEFDYIHRTDGDMEIYFVANRGTNTASADCYFRVEGKAPELWNAVTGEHQFADAYAQADGMIRVPLNFDPCGSWFVVFRSPAAEHPAVAARNMAAPKVLKELSGPWTVAFDPQWGGPERADFASLVSWPTRPEPGIKYYSGTATYHRTFELDASELGSANSKLMLDLGDVRELAEVTVNGKSCGIVWCPPWRVDVSGAARSGENQLDVAVVNFWPNRIIGDASLPPDQRRTRTNIRGLTPQTPLEPSGLFGPVQLLSITTQAK